jgi:hypothetical protein
VLEGSLSCNQILEIFGTDLWFSRLSDVPGSWPELQKLILYIIFLDLLFLDLGFTDA